LKVQAKIQEYTDPSISKTVNAPNNFTVEDVKRLYTLAYEWGCKGITFFRDGSRAGVLENVKEEKKEEKGEAKEETISDGNYLIERPFVVHGATYKIQTPAGKAFITINEDDNGEPMEVFVNVGKAGSDIAAIAEALGRTISATLRLKGKASAKDRAKEISEQLIGIGGRRSVGFGINKVRSLPDGIGIAIATHFGLKEANGHTTEHTNGHSTLPKEVQATLFAKEAETTVIATGTGQAMALFAEEAHLTGKQKADICPECEEHTLVFEEGCAKCYSCGHSEC
jgi:ribonucleoside-diphosphate reductase alpha chain